MRYLTAGESHGEALVGILEGFPAGVGMTAAYIERQLLRRRKAWGRSGRQRRETDTVRILGGLHRGATTGAPIALLIANRDARPLSASAVPLPGHADLAGALKYGFSDVSIVRERASARETAMRVALACFPRRLLGGLGITVAGRVVRIGDVVDERDSSGHGNLHEAMRRELDSAAAAGETLGGEFEVVARGVPLGLGSCVQWDRRLEGKIGAQFMSLNAVKALEIGAGFGLSGSKGSAAQDAICRDHSRRGFYRPTNRSGGIEGGMTNGELLVVRAGMKPLPGAAGNCASLDLRTGRTASPRRYRSDTCAVPAAAVIGESLLALALADALLEKFGSDSFQELKARVESWRQQCRVPLRRSA